MLPSLSRSLATVLCLALATTLSATAATVPPRDPGPPTTGGTAVASPAASTLALMIAEVWATPAALSPGAVPLPAVEDGSLTDLTDKKIKKAQAALAKAAKKLVKLDAKLAVLTALLSDTSDLLQPLQQVEPSLVAELADAELAWTDALALPTDTPEQKTARKQAVKLAKKAASVAKKAVKKTQKGIAKLQKKIDSTQTKVTKLSLTAAALTADMEVFDGALDELSVPFDFQMAGAIPVSVRVLDAFGLPVPYARVSWTDVLALPDPAPPGKGKGKGKNSQPPSIEELTSDTVYGQAFADENGVLQMDVQVPDHLSMIDMIVHAEDYTGPYTDEGLRELWDAFAPSARIAVTREDLTDFTITLTLDDDA